MTDGPSHRRLGAPADAGAAHAAGEEEGCRAAPHPDAWRVLIDCDHHIFLSVTPLPDQIGPEALRPVVTDGLPFRVRVRTSPTRGQSMSRILTTDKSARTAFIIA